MKGRGQMRKLILHIGGGKCGSSSLQKYLSINNSNQVNDKKYQYFCIYEDGTFSTGKDLVALAQKSVHGYLNCPASQTFVTDGTLRNSIITIISQSAEHVVPILSFEGWASDWRLFAENNVFAGLEISVEVLLYVRPPVEWFNSAWWQWGAWSEMDLEQWIDGELSSGSCFWGDIAEQWGKFENCRRVMAYDVKHNVIQLFCEFIGASINPVEPLRINVGSPRALLGFLLRNRKYRSGPHDPRYEFLLERYVRFSGKPAPWVLDRQTQAKILEETKSSNRKLIKYFPEKYRDLFLNDPRWSDIEAYKDRVVCDSENFSSLEDYDRLTADFTDAIKSLSETLSDEKEKTQQLERQNSILEHQNSRLESQNSFFENQNSRLERQNSLLESKTCLLESQNSFFESQNSLLRDQITQIKSSSAWRLAKPIRSVEKRLKRIWAS